MEPRRHNAHGRDVLRQAFERKLPRLLYIKAQHKGRGASEEFWFDEAHLLQGFSFESFGEQLRQGKILVDVSRARGIASGSSSA